MLWYDFISCNISQCSAQVDRYHVILHVSHVTLQLAILVRAGCGGDTAVCNVFYHCMLHDFAGATCSWLFWCRVALCLLGGGLLFDVQL